MNKFTHLHVHSEYSLLDGLARINELVDRSFELGMDSIAITDHGVMYGVIDFYKAAVAKGIKPILGCEVYVSTESRFDKTVSSDGNYYHLVLLAENNEGYENLVKLVSLGFTEGFYYKPRVDIELLRKYSKGIIALSACLAGVVAKVAAQVSYEKAKETALLYSEIFGEGNFFLELQDHGIMLQRDINQKLIRMSKETGIPLVATNDVHYIYEEDYKAHDVLLCVQTLKTINDEDRLKYEGQQFYLKSPDEMYDLFPYAKEALENTVKIADRCNVTIKFHEPKLPKFKINEGIDPFNYLRELCLSGLYDRYGKEPDKYLFERLDFELETIKDMGFVDYFLITWDFIKYAKDNGIAVGPGRGSAAGSIVSYCLNITNIDPIKYNLLFERFLNPERISMPDIDIDFCYERRQEVIDYVIGKYGEDHVAQIITFGTMAARMAIRDVGRALAIPYAEFDKIAKMIPFAIGMTLSKALEMNSELLKLYDETDEIKNLIDMCMRLEGIPRHASTHAAGVVICEKAVMDYVPLNVNDGAVTTQFPMNTLEELGLLKMDFLGLRTLTVIDSAVNEIRRSNSINIHIEDIDFDDKSVFELISRGETDGVFQLESSGMTQFMKELKPDSIEDVIAGVALYRPGPMDFIPKYIRGKNNKDTITYAHSSLENILKPTHGCIVYQEQVMQIVRDLAGYSLGRSDLLRRAMSKKKQDVMEKERHNFIYGIEGEFPGCVKNGIPEDVAKQIFNEIADFANYAFNKSHAAAYAIVSYQTAWLKKYYPVEFMAALMTSVMDNISKVNEYIVVCKKMGVKLLPPNINEGFDKFAASGNSIIFGLSAIKNVGRGIIKEIVFEREKKGKFKSLTEFCRRLSDKVINKRCLESLIKSGAFDCLGGFRSQYMASFKMISDGISQSKKKNISGQLDLFGSGNNAENIDNDQLPEIPEFPLNTLLNFEKDVLGMYVSGHPLSEFERILKRNTSHTSIDFLMLTNDEKDDLDNFSSGAGIAGVNPLDGKNVLFGGLISHKTVKYTKNNNAMAFINVEDLMGNVEVILFPNIYEKYSEYTQEDQVVIIKGKASFSEEENGKIIASEITPIQSLVDKASSAKNDKSDNNAERNQRLWLKITKDRCENDYWGLQFILEVYKGRTPVYVYKEATSQKLKMDSDHWIKVNKDSLSDLRDFLGEDCVVLKE